MRIKNSNLEWYVLRWSYSARQVSYYNILHGIVEDLAKEVRHKNIYNKDTLKNYLKTLFVYRYCNKSECEFYVSDLHGNDYRKIDMWKQIEPNLNQIVNYVNDRCNLKFK